jgi:hypothetical protein
MLVSYGGGRTCKCQNIAARDVRGRGGVAGLLNAIRLATRRKFSKREWPVPGAMCAMWQNRTLSSRWAQRRWGDQLKGEEWGMGVKGTILNPMGRRNRGKGRAEGTREGGISGSISANTARLWGGSGRRRIRSLVTGRILKKEGEFLFWFMINVLDGHDLVAVRGRRWTETIPEIHGRITETAHRIRPFRIF